MKNTSYSFGWTDSRTVLGFSEKPTPTHTRSIYREEGPGPIFISLMDNYEVHHGNKPETNTSGVTAIA